MRDVKEFAKHIAVLSEFGFTFGVRLQYSAAGENPGTMGVPGQWAVWDSAPGSGGDFDGEAFVGDDPSELVKRAFEYISELSNALEKLDIPEESETDNQTMTDTQYRAKALAEYGSEGSIEFDDEPAVSPGDDGGAYVQAWVWVYDDVTDSSDG